MRRRLGMGMALVAVGLLAAAPLGAQDQLPGRGRGLGRKVDGQRGRKAIRAEAPPELGALSGLEAVEALKGPLGDAVRQRGDDPTRYADALAADESLWIDATGQLLFVDALEHELPGPDDEPDTTEPTSSVPPPTPGGYLPSGLPLHHSKPGAPWTIFLDFDGATVRGGAGGWSFPVRSTIGLTIDADSLTFNAEEQAVISRTWGRVAEDWMPFDVDITTEQPALINTRVLWAIIGRSPRDFGFGSNVGGVSLFNFGYMQFGPFTPTFTFWEPWGPRNHSDIADTLSQENGHMFGLLHDGLRTDTGGIIEYYSGHGTGPTSWAPIMGMGGKNVTHWSRGDYPGHVNPFCSSFPCDVYAKQDDIAIIAGKLGFRADDVGDDIATAAALTVPASGVITSTTDVDVFALPRATDVNIAVTPFRAGELTDGGNLDVTIEIVNAAGLVVAASDDVNETAATLTAVLPSGQHYLRVRPSFNPDNYPIYDSLGQYTITGTFMNAVRMTGFAEPLPAATLNAGRTVPVKFTLSDTVSAARVQLWSDTSPLAATVLAEAGCQAQQGFRHHCNLKLPKTLESGRPYWIAVQFESLAGQWMTAQVVAGAALANPLAVTAR